MTLTSPPRPDRVPALSCRVFGHRPVFRAHERTMTWSCERGCGFEGHKQYPTAEAAARYAAAFDKRDGADLGKRAPLIGLLPLRLWRRMRTAPTTEPTR